ncbi:hypothetical protein BDR26DRAFT_871988 [Obelidium mucronatum]|nr:hypothetical protein BDR26DRAFT_871988 [Obelidium mucronatum]
MTDNRATPDEIKEFHFHLYWLTQSKQARANVEKLLAQIEARNKDGYFVAKPLRINEGPVGPHPMSSCEVWVPIEFFGRFYGWISQVRPVDVTLLDHTDRIAFMGPQAPLFVEALQPPVLDTYPLQYPELGLGYSKK